VIEPIRLHFAYSPDDWDRALRLHHRKSKNRVRDRLRALGSLLIAGVLFFACNLPLLQYGIVGDFSDYLLPLVWLLLAVVEWFDLAAVAARWMERRRRRNKTPIVYDFEFDASGARFTSDAVDAKLAWTEFSPIYKDEYSFLLMQSKQKGDYWLIPKQYFASAQDMDDFRRLAETNMPAPQPQRPRGGSVSLP
jgi:hypothetical protein